MNLKKWLAAVLACSAVALSGCGGNSSNQAAAPAEPAASEAVPAEAKVLHVGMNAEFPPFESQDAQGNVHGFDVDLLNALAAEGGFRVEFKNQPWDSLFNSLKNGDVDVLASAVTITEERMQSMAFTDPYFQISQVVLVQGGKNIASVEDLKSLNRVGVVTGNTGDLAAGKILGATNPKIARFENLPLLLKELENGGLDAAISDSSVVMEFIKNNSGKHFVMIEIPDFDTENYGLAVRKDDTATLDMLNKALAAIRANGEYERIHSRYFAKPDAPAAASEAAASEAK
ncbi:MAG: basic amino acid ABC transporter substrate-binding protein [Eikenella sp.]|nr:basic amino acid ABC transporter substrate-binding protein [Eikenella sp.]